MDNYAQWQQDHDTVNRVIDALIWFALGAIVTLALLWRFYV
jgi:hypothetical protein